MKSSKPKKALKILAAACAFCIMLTACQNATPVASSESPASATSVALDATTVAPTAEPTPVPSAEPPVPIKIFYLGSMSGGTALTGIQTDPVSMLMAEKTGAQLDFYPETTAEAFMTLLASGDLPDITVNPDRKLLPQMITGKMILPLDDLIQTNGQDILANAPQKIAYARKYLSSDTGKLYYIPGSSGPSETRDQSVFGFNMRWDLYKKLNYPEIKTYMDIIPILKDMVALNPTNADGQKVYGFSFNSDWDQYQPGALYPMLLGPIYGYQMQNSYHGEVDCKNPDFPFSSFFEENSLYFQGTEMLFAMNQADLLDPDSATQRWEDVSTKINAGRVLFGFVEWPVGGYNQKMVADGKPDIGFMNLYPSDSKGLAEGGLNPLGWAGAGEVISAKCEHPDKAMNILNYLHNPDGAMSIFVGIKGKQWDINADGQPYIPDDVYLKSTTDKTWRDTTGVYKYYNLSGLTGWNLNPKYNCTVDAVTWPTQKERMYTPVFKDYCKYFGVDTPYKSFFKNDPNKTMTGDPLGSFMEPMKDDIAAINQKISDMLRTETYKMIFAKDKATFDTVKAQIITKAKELGVDQELAWVTEQRKVAKQRYDEIMKK